MLVSRSVLLSWHQGIRRAARQNKPQRDPRVKKTKTTHARQHKQQNEQTQDGPSPKAKSLSAGTFVDIILRWI